MRWRGPALDVLLAVSAVGLDLLTNHHMWGTELRPIVGVAFSVLAGVPMGFVRRWPVAVTLYLAGLLIVTDQIVPMTANTVQILLVGALGMVAYTAKLKVTVPVAVVCAVASGFNLADPGVAFTQNGWYYSVGAALLPVLIGCYLRGPAGRLKHQDFAADALLGGGGVVLAVLGTWTEWQSGSQPVWVNGTCVVLAGLSLAVARRLPGMVFLFQVVLMVAASEYFPEAGGTGVFLILASVTVFAMRVESWVWTGLVYVVVTGVVGATIAEASGGPVTAVRLLVLMALTATPVAIGRYLQARQVATEAKRQRDLESQHLEVAKLRADQLAEREGIAREVHDIVAHHVGAMVLRASAARYADPDGPTAEALTDIRDTGHQVLEDLRGLLDLLRDPEREPDLLADPADVVRESAERMAAAGLLVELDVGPEVDHAPLIARASATRIVQEGLTNVLKHAGPGTSVRVSLAAAPDGLSVEIRNGRPPAPWQSLPSSGQGLRGMRERARALGGTLTAGPDEDGGWLLSVLLPHPGARGAA